MNGRDLLRGKWAMTATLFLRKPLESRICNGVSLGVRLGSFVLVSTGTVNIFEITKHLLPGGEGR